MVNETKYDQPEERVFKLRNANDSQEGRYLLTVYHPVPFGMGPRTFVVDAFEIQGTPPTTAFGRGVDGDIIVQFPTNFNYMLISRDRYETLTISEAEKLVREAEEEETKEEGDDKLLSPGRFTHI